MRRFVILSSCLLVLATGASVSLHRTATTAPPSGGMMSVVEVALPDANAQQALHPGNIIITAAPGFHMEVPGDTLAYNIQWGAGPRATGYSVTVSAVPTTGWLNLPTSFIQTGTVFLLRAVNTTQPDVNFTVTVCSRKGSTTYTNKCSVASWAVTRVPGPPGVPTIDSSMTIVGMRDWELLPEMATVWVPYSAAQWAQWDSASIAMGSTKAYRDSVKAVYAAHTQVQFCEVGLFTDNSRYPLGAFAVPADSVYCLNQTHLKYPGWGNSPNARALAKTYCPQYSATGGTITNTTCPTPPPPPAQG